MKIPRRKHKGELVSITPLIDVVFILLVFFMLAGAIEPSEPFDLAPPKTSAELRGDTQDYVVLISEAGSIALDDRVIPQHMVAAEIDAALTQRPGALIQLKPDADTEADLVIEVMEAIREGGADYIVLLTVAEDEAGTTP